MLAILVQKGIGCDYTIDCGTTYILLESDNYDDAREELKRIVVGYEDEEFAEEGQYLGDYELDEAIMVKDYQHAPTALWYGELREKEDAERKARQEKQEKAELARLQAKYKG